jgi:hypothetical protein
MVGTHALALSDHSSDLWLSTAQHKTPLAAHNPWQHTTHTTPAQLVYTRVPDPPVCQHHSPEAAWQSCSVQQVTLTEGTALNKGQVGLVQLLQAAVQHSTGFRL